MYKAFSLAAMIFASPVQAENNHNLPADLIFKGQPLPGSCIKALSFGDRMGPLEMDIQECALLDCPEDDKDKFEWSYLGEIKDDVHVIYTYLWPEGAMGKFSHVIFVRRDGDKLTIPYDLHGGDRHSTMIRFGELDKEKGTFNYVRHVANGTFSELPGCSQAPESRCIGEACYLGVSFWSLTWEESEAPAEHFLGFTPAEGGPSLQNAQEPYEVLSAIMTEDYLNHGTELLSQTDLEAAVAKTNRILEERLEEKG